MGGLGRKEVTADQALLAHVSSPPWLTKEFDMDCGRSFPVTKCGKASGCRSRKACSTLGSWELANPVDTNIFVALDSAPSSTNALIFPTWDGDKIPSSSILARAHVRAGCSAGLRCTSAFASVHNSSSCPDRKRRSLLSRSCAG